MNLSKIIKEEVNDFEDLNWIDKVSDEWNPRVGDKFICKFGFTRWHCDDKYGGAAYEYGRVYTIKSISLSRNDGDTVFFTVEDEDGNGVYKKAAEPYFEYLSESEEDDFYWAEGDVTYTIDFILGMKCTYRKNNLSELEIEYDLSMLDLNRGDVELGKIKKESYWWITRVEGNKVVITLKSGHEMEDYTIEEVEQYVNLGIWALLDENGNILNDFSK